MTQAKHTKAFTALYDGSIGIAEQDKAGYTPTTYKFDTYQDAKNAADQMNAERGLDKRTALMIAASSMKKGVS